MKVSFDFDQTLDREDVQEYAKSLIKRGIEVWICTARPNDPKRMDNSDIYEVATTVGIPKDRIIFTNYEFKLPYLKDFLWHLDDEVTELREFINTDVKGIYSKKEYKNKCETLILNEIAKEHHFNLLDE